MTGKGVEKADGEVVVSVEVSAQNRKHLGR